MSESVRTTPSCDDMLSNKGRPAQRLQSPLATINNIFAPGADYSDHAYCPPIPSGRASPVDTTGIDMIHRVRGAMENWTAALGPVEDWPRVFREQYDEACINTTAPTTQVAINVFLGQVEEHVRVGKDIIAGLEGCTAVKLTHSQSAEGDRLLAGDLMRTLHRGVALLEARLELHAPSGPHTSPLQSNIRRHEEFLSLDSL